jgi:VanZ family protein
VRSVVARTAFLLLLVVSLVMFLAPAPESSPAAPDDKLVHALTFATLALSGLWARVPLVPLGLGLLGYAVLTEVLQAVLPIERHGDVRDAVADAIGVVVVLAVAWAVSWWRRRDVMRCGGSSDQLV